MGVNKQFNVKTVHFLPSLNKHQNTRVTQPLAMDEQLLLQKSGAGSLALPSFSLNLSGTISKTLNCLQHPAASLIAFAYSSDPDSVVGHQQKLKHAKSYEEWKTAAERLDQLLGYDLWKQDSASDIYDHELVRMRTEELRACRVSGDNERLLFLVRTSFQRNLGNMGDPKLYEMAYTGTKQLIEDYISECEAALETLLECGDSATDKHLADSHILDMLVQTRKAFGRTALVLSGGSVLGIIHTGVMHELLHQNLLPRIISGSSAGSIFASVLCVHFDYEIDELFDTLIREKFDIFEETGNEESFFVRLARFLKHGTILDNKYLAQTMQSLLGDLTFQEAYNRTRKILNVTVSPASIHEAARLLNYLTAPNVLIWSAVCASCSVPFIFSSYTLLAKDAITGEHYPWSASPLKYIDGSVDNDLPLIRLSELFNVDHFIACQVNPHVVPFVKLQSSLLLAYKPSQLSWVWHETQNFLNDEFSHYLLVASELGILKNVSSKLRSLLTQQYTGDITIVPDVKISELKDLFKNPTTEKFQDAHLRGAHATWPQLSIIRNHCAIELALDQSIHKLRSRLIPHEKTNVNRNSAHRELGRKQFYSTANIQVLASPQMLQAASVRHFHSNRHNSASASTMPPSMQPVAGTKQQQQLNQYQHHQQQPQQQHQQHHQHHQHQQGSRHKQTNHVRHKSEGLSILMPPMKRKSSQDLASMFSIGVSPSHRTAWSPSISRGNSFKALTNNNNNNNKQTLPSGFGDMTMGPTGLISKPSTSSATKLTVMDPQMGAEGGKYSPEDSMCSSTTVSPAVSRRTSLSGGSQRNE